MDQIDEIQLMETYKIEDSIEDVITILDSAPPQPDLMPERNLVQLTNRGPIAHLGIERGLKHLIKGKGIEYKRRHDLDKQFVSLGQCDQESAGFISEAFTNVVEFYNYDVERLGFEHFSSIEAYLFRVGTFDAFQAMRYWAIGEPAKAESPFQYLSLPIHREILCALRFIILSRPRTVSQRVELAVKHAMGQNSGLWYGDKEMEKADSVNWYLQWLGEHSSFCDAFEDAAKCNFVIKDNDDYVNSIVFDAWQELRQSKDPAVQYFCYKQTYLQPGSQLANSDAIPEVSWINKEHTRAEINASSGRHLGIVDKLPDGAWAFRCLGSTSGSPFGAAVVLKDAKNYMVNTLTFLVDVRVAENTRQLRIFGRCDRFPEPDLSNHFDNPVDSITLIEAYQLEFWDKGHGLSVGNDLAVFPASELGQEFITVLQGKVTSVSEQNVTVEGMVTAALTEEVQH